MDAPQPVQNFAPTATALPHAGQNPEVTARLAGLGIFPFTLPTHTAYGQYIQSEIKKYGEVVKGAGVKAD